MIPSTGPGSWWRKPARPVGQPILRYILRLDRAMVVEPLMQVAYLWGWETRNPWIPPMKPTLPCLWSSTIPKISLPPCRSITATGLCTCATMGRGGIDVPGAWQCIRYRSTDRFWVWRTRSGRSPKPSGLSSVAVGALGSTVDVCFIVTTVYELRDRKATHWYSP